MFRKEISVPKKFLCSISNSGLPMKDPVYYPRTKRTYERKNIEFQLGLEITAGNCSKADICALASDVKLKKEIQGWIVENKPALKAEYLDYDYLFKIVLLGSYETGKSCLLRRYAKDKYTEDKLSYKRNTPIYGITNPKIKRSETNESIIEMKIWESKIQYDEYDNFRKALQDCDGIILVFSLTDLRSFEKIKQQLDEVIKKECPENIILVGTKSDLVNEREVDYAEAKKFADEKRITYIETSAKTPKNVDLAFETLAKQIKTRIENNKIQQIQAPSPVSEEASKNKIDHENSHTISKEELATDRLKEKTESDVNEPLAANMLFMQSYLSSLPSIDEAYKDYNKVTSDHTPILATIPYQKKSAGLEEIRIVSWNVLEDDNGNGFAPNGQKNFNETLEQRKQRHHRIADSLASFAKNYQPQFITLQEIHANTDKESLFQLIKANLGEAYACVMAKDNNVVDIGGCITFFRTGQFKPVICEESESCKNAYHVGGNVIKFKWNGDANCEVRISNVHHTFTEYTIQHEENIKTFLNGQDKAQPAIDKNRETLSIITGDFNGSIASLDDKPRNSVTSVSPSCFRVAEGDVDAKAACDAGLQAQGAWSIDGCFYSIRSKNQKSKSAPFQATTLQLNPTTGKCYTEEELRPIAIEALPPFQRKEITKYRLVISVDRSYDNKIVINDNHTIFSYEQELQEKFHDYIYVRRAANLNNEKGIGVIVNKELYQYFLQLKHPNFQLEDKNDLIDSQPFRVIYVGDSHIPELLQEMEMVKLNQAIASLKKSKQFKPEEKILTAFEEFSTAIRNEPDNRKQPYPIVTEHFAGLANRLLQGPMNAEEIEQSMQALNYKLYGRPPLNAKIKAIIYGIIGALIGLAIGVILTGGFGAIPGMALGATVGSAAGVALTAGTTVAGVLTGSTLGFFSAKQNNKNYVQQCEARKAFLVNSTEKQQAVYAALRSGL